MIDPARLSDKEAAALRQFIERLSKARPAIVEDIKRRGALKQSVSGKIECPICDGGTLHYSYAGSFNGHIHARCTTEDCVSWME